MGIDIVAALAASDLCWRFAKLAEELNETTWRIASTLRELESQLQLDRYS
jgi:hypothetical protein